MLMYAGVAYSAPLAQITKDFGLSVTTLKRWIAIAEHKEAEAQPGIGVVCRGGS